MEHRDCGKGMILAPRTIVAVLDRERGMHFTNDWTSGLPRMAIICQQSLSTASPVEHHTQHNYPVKVLAAAAVLAQGFAA
jgi:hypothetical protein